MDTDEGAIAAAPGERYRHVTEAVFARPWAIERSKLLAIGEMIRARIDGWRIDPQAAAELAAAARRPVQHSSGATAVIPLYGTILWRVGGIEASSGASSLQDFSRAFDAALANDAIKSIVIDVDSPGGQIDGVPETAAKIFEARGKKPLTAVVNTLGASAAYWLAAAADEIVASPSAMVGSVGVYMLHEDWSAAAEQAGVRFTFIEAPEGGYKTEGNPYAPLSEEAGAYAQQMVNDLYGWFVRDVARFRGVTEERVRSDYGKGRVFLARDAERAGMVDRIASLEQVLQRHGGADQATSVRARRAEDGAPAPAMESPAPLRAEDLDFYMELTAAQAAPGPQEEAA